MNLFTPEEAGVGEVSKVTSLGQGSMVTNVGQHTSGINVGKGLTQIRDQCRQGVNTNQGSV